MGVEFAIALELIEKAYAKRSQGVRGSLGNVGNLSVSP
jgi:hypothetical protein